MNRTLDRDRPLDRTDDPVAGVDESDRTGDLVVGIDEPDRARRLRDLAELVEHGLQAGIGVGHSLGVLLTELGDGTSTWTLTPSPAAANAMMTVHGGVISTLMDTSMGSAVYTRLPAGLLYATLELKVNFIRAVRLDGGMLTCVGRAVHVGRRTATAEARVTDPSGALIAHGTSTCLLFETAAPPA